MADALRGFNGRILKVDLGAGRIDIETPGADFYRKYPGGSAIGAFYCLKEMKPGADPLGPGNVLVFAAGPATGAALSGASRFNATAKSPLTGAIGDSQCGGWWGPELKAAGFDAVVIRGKAKKPVRLMIADGKAALKDASKLWGLFTADTRAAIKKKTGDPRARTLCIGPAGEKKVRFACVSGGPSDYAGRTGMGAVMGAKNLKAITCRGTVKPAMFDNDGIARLRETGAKNFKNATGFLKVLRELGTAGVVKPQAGSGNLCTRNFANGAFAGLDALSGETMKERIVSGGETCFGCVIRCKKLVKADAPYELDPVYGGPEFETIGLLGSNLEIADIAAVARGNQLCNAWGIDTISAGAMIAYAIESFERGFITRKDTGGRELRFGDPATMLELLELIGARKGIGARLADGMEACIAAFGEKTRPFAMQVKNNPFPAHMPQAKPGQALMYAVNPFGADHMSSEHDWLASSPGEDARGLGIHAVSGRAALDDAKITMVVYSQFYYGLMDTLCLCDFCWGPGALFTYHDLEDLVRAATGWDMSLWELMKAGERRVNMLRAFNAREGFGAGDDTLPERVFKPMAGPGEAAGKHVPKRDFKAALKKYYAMMNWNASTGAPTPAKLAELGLEWIAPAKTNKQQHR